MKNLKLTLIAVLLGILGVLCGIALSYFLLPTRQPFCIGLFLVIAAFIMGRRYPAKWPVLSFAVAIPYLVQLVHTVPALVDSAETNGVPVPPVVYLVLLSPALMALAGGWYGARVARRMGGGQS